MRIIGLVPARGSSKRLPRKNVRPLLGVPLIAWTIESARRSDICTDLVVSTDDSEIAAIAREWGAEVIQRPPELSTDTASSVDVALHALDQVNGRDGDGLLLLQPTSPFRTPADLQRAVRMFDEGVQRHPVVSVSPATPHPSWCFSLVDQRLQPLLGWSGVTQRSQDLPPAYALNGSIYLIATGTLRVGRTFLTQDSRALIMDGPLSNVDIDTAADWAVAEAAARVFGAIPPSLASGFTRDV